MSSLEHINALKPLLGLHYKMFLKEKLKRVKFRLKWKCGCNHLYLDTIALKCLSHVYVIDAMILN